LYRKVVCSTQGVLEYWVSLLIFVRMYFKSSIRNNPATGKIDSYFRLVESYRNVEGRVSHRTLLNVGFLPEVSAEQLNKIQTYLTARHHQKINLFEESDPLVTDMTNTLWDRLITEKRIDVQWSEKASKLVNIETIKHSNVREIGAEWMSYNTWNLLKLSEFLDKQGWAPQQVQLAATQVISRAVYPASELKTCRWIKDNSAVCDLTGYEMEDITKDKLYEGALRLYEIKDKLQTHLSSHTNTLFDLPDKIILYDLTNTYFEGRKANSRLARYGKSKERRNDAKLVVLAMVINIEGFIKYTAIHEGNIADCSTLESMINKLSSYSSERKAIIVIDAGIATEENLQFIKQKGYHYVGVNRTRLKDYEVRQDRFSVLLETKTKQHVRLKAITTDKSTDYYLEVKSALKTATQTSMKNQFEQRFEEQLQKIRQALFTKGGVKMAHKVYERIGRAKQKYPSVHHYYDIELTVNDKTKHVSDMHWKINYQKHQDNQKVLGRYFLRTDLDMKDEMVLWNIYNTIREIESSFRCLKNDLALRPVYHKNDDSSMAHLHLGILAYWLVNTMRYQLKAKGIKSCWTELVRIGNTQKVITTTGQNVFDKIITTRKCSEPPANLKTIYDALNLKYKPYGKQKSVVHKSIQKKLQLPPNQIFTPP
jgi:transposase